LNSLNAYESANGASKLHTLQVHGEQTICIQGLFSHQTWILRCHFLVVCGVVFYFHEIWDDGIGFVLYTENIGV